MPNIGGILLMVSFVKWLLATYGDQSLADTRTLSAIYIALVALFFQREYQR
jgi:hypothetical protein